jgi:hypothetical protein
LAQGQAALTGTVNSDAEGKMEGVVVTASKPGSIVEVSVTTDAQGRYSFPESRLDPGEYAISIRAVGYDIDNPAKATVAPEPPRRPISDSRRPKILPANSPTPSG